MPAPTVVGNAANVATDGTEQELFNTATNAYYGGGIDLANMGSGNSVSIRLYKAYKSGGTLRLVETYTFVDAQSNPGWELPMLHAPYGYKLTLEKTAGSNFNFDWYVVSQ